MTDIIQSQILNLCPLLVWSPAVGVFFVLIINVIDNRNKLRSIIILTLILRNILRMKKTKITTSRFELVLPVSLKEEAIRYSEQKGISIAEFFKDAAKEKLWREVQSTKHN
jgi:hypothetical protein